RWLVTAIDSGSYVRRTMRRLDIHETAISCLAPHVESVHLGIDHCFSPLLDCTRPLAIRRRAPGGVKPPLGRLLKCERPVLDLARSFVFGDHNSGAGRLAVNELQPGRDGAVGEEALAAAEQDGKYE